ncbi:MAG: hypothetical protein IJU84_05865, partial [Clostridia bacterium]|nr:hypothetical protein [Clostridia bacterium]
TSAVAWSGRVFGWFSTNKNVDMGGLNFNTKSRNLTVTAYELNEQKTGFTSLGDLSAGNDIEFTLDIPGSSYYLLLEISNADAEALEIQKINFNAPGALETPVSKTVDGTTYYYWFSSQLSVASKLLGTTMPNVSDVTGAAYGTAVSLDSATTLNGTTVSTAVPEEKTVYTKGATETTTVANNSKIYIALKITFVNDAENNQNVYKNFGKTTGDDAPKCSRTINILYN